MRFVEWEGEVDFGGDILTFNSLFEIPKAEKGMAVPDEVVTFNSLFEILLWPASADRLASFTAFQFSF